MPVLRDPASAAQTTVLLGKVAICFIALFRLHLNSWIFWHQVRTDNWWSLLTVVSARSNQKLRLSKVPFEQMSGFELVAIRILELAILEDKHRMPSNLCETIEFMLYFLLLFGQHIFRNPWIDSSRRHRSIPTTWYWNRFCAMSGNTEVHPTHTCRSIDLFPCPKIAHTYQWRKLWLCNV